MHGCFRKPSKIYLMMLLRKLALEEKLSKPEGLQLRALNLVDPFFLKLVFFGKFDC